jgi:predicted ATPase/DNA-binding winged helix-turn-helix (wHTH) protein
MDCTPLSRRSFVFGPFVLIPDGQMLLQDETPVRIGSRSLDLLTALVERAGELVTKRELMARVWPRTVVEECNLKVNMAALRRALGDGPGMSTYIATVTGRGYRFTAPVQGGGLPGFLAPCATRRHNLPAATTKIVGRADAIDRIRQDLSEVRLLSIVGPGGIGKTTVALAAAEQAVGSFRHGVWLVDLAPTSDPADVPEAIATSLGLALRASDPLGSLCEGLRDREMLLVLDSCEHLIDAVACCIDRILAVTPEVKVLATSRESLRVRGEFVRCLSGLDAPLRSSGLTADEALASPAVQLFVDHATCSYEPFELSDAEAPAVAEICTRLDGNALAIELAARRIECFGVFGLLKQLDDRFRLLVGRRGGPERHRTLAATLDWSYAQLAADAAAVLCAVSVFEGAFDADDAVDVSGIAPAAVADILAQLAAKSLLSTELDAKGTTYRLPETTRRYCLERLPSYDDFSSACSRTAARPEASPTPACA